MTTLNVSFSTPCPTQLALYIMTLKFNNNCFSFSFHVEHYEINELLRYFSLVICDHIAFAKGVKKVSHWH